MQLDEETDWSSRVAALEEAEAMQPWFHDGSHLM